MKKINENELFSGIATLVMSIAALILFGLSFTTNYYTFGQMNSGVTAVLIVAAIVIEIVSLFLRSRKPENLIIKLLTLVVTACLAAASMLLLGDRVEGIGNAIVTDYDSGHGAEEAIYMSIAASILMIIGIIYNIVGSFNREKPKEEVVTKNRSIAHINVFVATGLIALLAVVLPTAALVRMQTGGASGGSSADGGSGSGASTTYTVNYSQSSGNAEGMPTNQFISGDVSGLIQADARLNVDITLNLSDDGTYSLTSDAYVIEAGERAVIGDSTGLGLVLTTTAEGSYTTNDDGTVTTEQATHAVFDLGTDTYSAQMKDVMGISIGGSNEDGTYDSADYPEILNFVPETTWTLGDGVIESYTSAGAGSSAEGGSEESQAEESQAAETTDESATEAGGSGEALAEVSSGDGATTISFYADGTYVFNFASYNVEDAGTYTYDGTTLTVTNASGTEMTAEGDPLELHYVSSVSDQLTGDFSIPTADLSGGASAEGEESSDAESEGASSEESSAESEASDEGSGEVVTEVSSTDGATTMTFYDDGTYIFSFAQYNVEDAGTYTYDGTTLTITNASGTEMTVEGDPLELHYVSSVSDQLTGDFSIPAADLS